MMTSRIANTVMSIAGAVALTIGAGGGGVSAAAPTNTVDGVATSRAAIMPTSVGIIDSTCTGSVLRTGSSGRCVHILQLSINSLFKTYLVPDAQFGAATEGWVRGIQARYGLTVDGIVGAKTWATLQYCEMRSLNGLPY